MKVNRKELLNILEKLQPGLASKEIIEQSNRYILQSKCIRTYNDEVAVTYPITTELEGAIPSGEFYKVISKFPDKNITLETDNKEITIRGKKRRTKINIDITIELPNIKTDIKKWNTLPKDFSDAISFCVFSTSKDATDPALTCLFISKDKVWSNEDVRGTVRTMKGEVKEEFLLPNEVVNALVKYNPIKYCIKKSWLHFANEDGSIFSCRTVDDDYPNIEDFFKVEGTEIILPKEFSSIVERSHLLQTAEEKLINVLLTKDRITCIGEAEVGKSKEWEDIEYDGPDISIYVNPIFLSQILTHLQTVTIGKRLLFKGENFKHAVCVAT